MKWFKGTSDASDFVRSFTIDGFDPSQTIDCVGAGTEEDVRLAEAMGLSRREVLSRRIKILDALGAPIVGARVNLYASPPSQSHEGDRVLIDVYTTDAEGRIDVTPLGELIRLCKAEVIHPDYGRAFGRLYSDDLKPLRFPLLLRDSPAMDRAVRGTVLDPEGNPMADVAVEVPWAYSADGYGRYYANEVNMSGVIKRAVFTDEAGKFTIYLPYEPKVGEFSDLLPRGTKYFLHIVPPKASGLLPILTHQWNNEEIVHRLPAPTQKHRLEFQYHDGRGIEPRFQRMFNWSVVMEDDVVVPVPREDDQEEALFPKGDLRIAVFGSHGWDFPDVPINDATSPTIVLKAAPPVVYTGRVVDVGTGEPFDGAIVMTHNRSRKGGLASLTKEDWAQLNSLPPNLIPHESGLRRIRDIYGYESIMKTGPDGRFRIEALPSQNVYTVLVIAENRLGWNEYVNSMDVPETLKLDLGDLYMIPCGKAKIKLVGEEIENPDGFPNPPIGLPNTMFPHLRLNPDAGSPLFREAIEKANLPYGNLVYTTHLAMNKEEQFLVPAGVQFRLVLESPYGHSYLPIWFDEPMIVEEGGILELGEVPVEPAPIATVTVIDENGSPVEGMPVWHRRYNPVSMKEETYPARVTGGDGVATFPVYPGTEGFFFVTSSAAERPNDQGWPQAAYFVPQGGRESINRPIVVGKDLIEQIRAGGIELSLKQFHHRNIE